jgi:hypothetical protein
MTELNIKQKLSVTIYASAHIEFDGTREDLEEACPDIYMPSSLGDDKEDLGADNYSFSVNGDNDKVLVDKGLLLALVAQCQDYSDNELVCDDANGTSYSWTELNKLVDGHRFPIEVTGANSDYSKQEILDYDRRTMAIGIYCNHDFGTFTRINSDDWNIEGDDWTREVTLMDPDGRKATTTVSIKFEPEFTNVKKVSQTPVQLIKSPDDLHADRKSEADSLVGGYAFGEYSVKDTGNWAVAGNEWVSRIFLETDQGEDAACDFTVVFAEESAVVKTNGSSNLEKGNDCEVQCAYVILSTSDDCKISFDAGFNDSGFFVSEREYQGSYNGGETVNAFISVLNADISGDDWREIESSGRLEEMMKNVVFGEQSVEEFLFKTTSTAEQQEFTEEVQVTEAEAPKSSFDILDTPVFAKAKSASIFAVLQAALAANVSAHGYQIDEMFTDCGEIESANAVSVIDECAGMFGYSGSENYKFIVNALCEAVTSHFAEWHPAEA